MATLRETSKKTWGSNDTIEHINAGSLQRIADATELMATNFLSLQEENTRYKKWYYEERDNCKELRLRLSALRGVITKLKQKGA